MKPTFALDFRDGKVTLLHRTSRGWSLVGSAEFGAPDFEEALSYLRSTAIGLSPRGITTKLILPGDQILYTDVEVATSDASRQRRLIRLALEGRTPYPVEDLAWDWSGEGPVVQVAVIAKETLAEAEAFATEHRFNPVSWVAVPEPGQFTGEPFFGMTSAAPGILGADKVERDEAPVVQVLHEPPKPEPGPAITEADFVPPVLDARDLPEEPEPEAAQQEAAPDEVTEVGAPLPDPQPEPQSEPAAEPAPQPEAAIPPSAAGVPPPKADPAQAPQAQAPQAQAPQAQAPQARAAQAPEAPMALDVIADPFVEDDDLPPAPPAAVAMLASRKAETEAKGLGGASRPGPAAVPGAIPTPPVAAAPTVPRPSLAKPAKGETIAFPGKGKTKGKTAGVTSPTIPGIPRREKNVVTLPTAEGAAAEAPAKPARPSPVLKGRPEIGGKPRYLGLALTVGLLVLLAAVAVWSSFFMGTDDSAAPVEGATGAAVQEGATASLDAAGTGAAATTPETAAAALPEAAPQATPEAVAAAPEGPGTAADQADTETASADAAVPTETPAETPTEAPTTVVASLSAPQTPADGDSAGLSLAAADTPPGVTAPQALQPLARGTDSQPTQPPAPPPFGTVYKFDAQGRIEPTPEGILTPEGVLLVAGKPALVPPSRPAELTVTAPEPAPQPAAAPGAIAPVPPETTPEPLPAADPALEGKRPAARPADLAPQADQQGAVAASPEDLRLAALRPEARPEGLAPPPSPEPPPQNNASLMATGAPLLTAPVTRAPRPQSRPTDLTRAVDDAVTAALDQPAAQPQAEVIDEPELEDNPMPRLPTNASVARQATTENAINTRKLALLAVFGTNSNRFAMVRQPNGAVKKVKVGDALDGGRIAAITANALQYQKGGRMLTLQLPTG